MNVPDDARDPWLSRALRHAPDADVEPSRALGETILRQARSGAARPPLRHRLDARWSWLAQPAVASGLATLTLSTVIGVWWWSGTLEDAAQRRAEPAAERAAPAPADVPVAPPGAVAPPPPVQPQADGQPRAQVEPPAPARPRAQAVPPAPAARADNAQRDRAAAPREETRAVPDLAAPPAPPAAESRAEPATGAAPADAAAPAARAATKSEGLGALAGRFAAPRADPLGLLAPALLERGPAFAFEWRSTAAAHGHADRQRAWFERLHVATAGRWRPATQAPTGLALQLYENSTLRADIVLAGDGVYWAQPAHGAWFAPLAAAEAAALRALVAAW
jgi:hypothetical protein